jgi:hypothetical protein
MGMELPEFNCGSDVDKNFHLKLPNQNTLK